MANQWFRLYSEFAFDPKVQILTEALQRRYVMLLCLHCDGKYENRPVDELALSLRVTVEEMTVTLDELKHRGLVTREGKINGWDKRQYISDVKDPTAAERQRRYREKRRNARNDTVTSRAPESDTDTETDPEKEKNKQKRKSATGFKPPTVEEVRAYCAERGNGVDPELFCSHYQSNGWKVGKNPMKDWKAAVRTWEKNQREQGGNGSRPPGETWQAKAERLGVTAKPGESEFDFRARVLKHASH
mgnify:CR=1 FL=1